MRTMESLDERLRCALKAKGWDRRGRLRFVGETHLIDVIPGTATDRVTFFFGRCVHPGDPARLTQCSRLTFRDVDELDRFLQAL